MTLFHQIAFLVSLMFVVLLGGVAMNDFRQSGEYLQGQMHSNAQDMVTVLGMTVANTSADDVAALETLFNAFFDSGYYSAVELRSPQGEMIHAKRQHIAVSNVPQWFVDFVPLQPATGLTNVMKGWRLYGTLSVTLHPGYAYAALYQNFTTMWQWFLGFSVIGLLVLWGVLFLLLRPLRAVHLQAEAIHDNQFIIQERLPWTRELRKVVMAVNRMVGKVQTVFDEQTDVLKRHHDLMYEDGLTGLGNRRFLLMKLKEICEDEGVESGWMVIFHINGLMEMNQVEGYLHADKCITQFSQQLRNAAASHHNHQCVRLKASEFAVYITGTESAARQLIDEVFVWMREHGTVEHADSHLWLCAGYTEVVNGCSVSSVLSDLDFALVQSKDRGAYGIQRAQSANSALPQGKVQWRAFLEQSLHNDRFFLVGQMVKNIDETIHHREMIVRLLDQDDTVVSAGMFMPIAAEVGLDFDIEKSVFNLAMGLEEHDVTESLALNLSRSVLNRADALSEFSQFLIDYSRLGRAPLYVEISHFDLINAPESALHIANLLKQAGHHLAIDRLDLGMDLQPLKFVLPRYVKIGANMMADMANSEIEAGFNALRALVGSLEIKLIAVGVDSDELYQRLKTLGVDAVQGNHIAEPTRIA